MIDARRLAQVLDLPTPTAEQRAVIEAPLRSALVIAGAGSGKTETMAARVVWLVANGLVEPERVLGLTFTRKAAGELGRRIEERLRRLGEAGIGPAEHDQGAGPTVSTYHAYAGRLVAENALRLGLEPDSQVITAARSWQLVNALVSSYDGPLGGGDDTPAPQTVEADVSALSAELAEHLVSPAELDTFLERLQRTVQSLPPGAGRPKRAAVDRLLARTQRRRELVPLLTAFADRKRELGVLDFADQLALAARLARRHPVIGLRERRRFQVVLLDEFQDTSEAQLVLLSELFAVGPESTAVLAVGDPHQSIYGWRGASATTMARFPELFGAGQEVPLLPLSTSWRNDAAILEAANLVAAPLRVDQPAAVPVLRPREGAGAGAVEVGRYLTIEDEAGEVAAWFAAHLEPGRTSAVLCRKRSAIPAVVAALEERGLPVQVVGVGGLLELPGVRDLVALLNVVVDPARGDHLVRLLTGPVARLGPADLAVLGHWARHLGRATVAGPVVLADALRQMPPVGYVAPTGQGLSAVARTRCQELAAVIDQLRDLPAAQTPDLVAQARRLLHLDADARARSADPGAARHLDAFATVTHQFCTQTGRPTPAAFVAYLDAAAAAERGLEAASVQPNPEAVQVLTVHAAKGLEWDLVACPGMVEGTFPAHRARSTYRDETWQVGSITDTAWLAAAGALPYDLRGDRLGLPELGWASAASVRELSSRIEEFALACGDHAMADERRLAYVAFTRARRRLLLTAPVWSDASRPRVPSRFLREVAAASPAAVLAWAEPEPGEAPTNPRFEPDGLAQWPEPIIAPPGAARAAAVVQELLQRDDLADLHAGSDLEDADLEADLELVLAAATQVTAPATAPVDHVTTSQAVALATDPAAFLADRRRPMPTAPSPTARAGTRFHAWVQEHYRSTPMLPLAAPGGAQPEPTSLEPASLAAAGLEPANAESVSLEPASHEEQPGQARRAEQQNHDERWREAFLASPWAAIRPREVELPVETTIDGIAVRGRIDAVFAADDGRVTIVDWKTGDEPRGAAAGHRAVQLSAYRLAYARLRGLPMDQVDAAFYYVGSGRTVRPELLDEAGLRAVLAPVISAR